MQKNLLKISTLSFLFINVIFAQKSQGATITSPPPVSFQLNQVAQWFTGLFNNTKQVANNPIVPQITMSNCGVKLIGNECKHSAHRVSAISY